VIKQSLFFFAFFEIPIDLNTTRRNIHHPRLLVYIVTHLMVAVSVLSTLEVQLVDTAALWASIEIVVLVEGQPDSIVGLSGVA
jgi:hypothetical protein